MGSASNGSFLDTGTKSWKYPVRRLSSSLLSGLPFTVALASPYGERLTVSSFSPFFPASEAIENFCWMEALRFGCGGQLLKRKIAPMVY